MSANECLEGPVVALLSPDPQCRLIELSQDWLWAGRSVVVVHPVRCGSGRPRVTVTSRRESLLAPAHGPGVRFSAQVGPTNREDGQRHRGATELLVPTFGASHGPRRITWEWLTTPRTRLRRSRARSRRSLAAGLWPGGPRAERDDASSSAPPGGPGQGASPSACPGVVRLLPSGNCVSSFPSGRHHPVWGGPSLGMRTVTVPGPRAAA